MLCFCAFFRCGGRDDVWADRLQNRVPVISSSEQQSETEMATGKVLWFNPVMGHGYIEAGTGSTAVPVLQHAVEMSGYKTLKAGQTVRYELARGIDGKIRAASLR